MVLEMANWFPECYLPEGNEYSGFFNKHDKVILSQPTSPLPYSVLDPESPEEAS